MDGSADKIDAEDGEIEDAKMSDAPVDDSIIPDAVQPSNQTSMDTANAVTESTLSVAPSEAPNLQHKGSPAPVSMVDDMSSRASRLEYKPTLPAPSGPPPRPDMSRTPSLGLTNGRAPHNLPSKPEPSQNRPGDHRMLPRTGERLPHDHPREPRYPERVEPRDILRDRGLERSASGPYAHGAERPQAMERDRMDQRWNNAGTSQGRSSVDDRHNGSHGRDSRYSARDDRQERPPDDRQFSESHQSRRDVDATPQQPRDVVMPPPRSNISQHPINPERAALIQGGSTQDRGQPSSMHPDRRPDTSRYDDPLRSERTSRAPSPARGDDRHPSRYDGRREDPPSMHGRRPTDDITRPRFDEPHAPTGPRTGRPASTGAGSFNSNDRFRESMKPSAVAPPIDPNHGRLSHESSFPNRQGESQYGRLNSDSDIPSGPRMPNGNHSTPGHGGRNVSAPQPRLNTQVAGQNQGPPTPVHDRQAPSGPSMRGSPRKPPPFSQHPVNTSAPPTPVTQSPDTGSIHPDRLRALQGAGAVTTEDLPQNRGGQRQGPYPVAMPPRGPMNNQLPSPVGPPANHRGPPTGPAMPNDRSGRDKRTLTGIQTVLQQASGSTVPERSGQGASIRGRGGRANNANGPSPGNSAPPTPSFPRPDQPLREDLFAGGLNGTMGSQQPEDDAPYGRGGRRGGPRDGPRDGDRRNGSHRSHSAGKDRSTGAPPRMREDEMLQGRDGPRDRPRGNEGPPNRDTRGGSGQLEVNVRGGGGPPERDLRDRGPPRDTRRPGRDDGQFRDRRGEPDVRDGPDRRDDRDRRDGGGSGRKRGRGGDEGQGERNFSDSKRPRR